MTETKVGIILVLENNTNPFELLGNCRSCQENWMNRGHEKTRLCLEHENKITFYLLFHCSGSIIYRVDGENPPTLF